jgi:hypothetical protein
MKAISVRAPWWWCILHAGKTHENRDWSTNFRGTVYLHASKFWRIDEISDDWDDIKHIASETSVVVPRMGKEETEAMRDAGGCIVGTIDIVGCVNASNSPWFFGKYGFVLANPIAFERPIPFKGALMFFDVPDGIEVQG